MRPHTSLFLDFLRVAAAATVLVTHCFQLWDPGVYALTANLGNHAVVVFFVLSGYLIAFATLSRGKATMRSYAISRISRLYSVLVPSILVTILLFVIGTAINPAAYGSISRGHEVARALACLANVQSIWFTSTCPPTNGPLWSLSYEFWYYAIFGCFMLLKRPFNLAAALACAAIAGPNILLLFPCWIVGAAAYMWAKDFNLSFKAALGGMVGTLIAAAVVAATPPFPYSVFNAPFFYASSFLTDGVMAVVVAFSIIFIDAMPLRRSLPVLSATIIRFLASRTFSLYLLHFPLLVFATALFPDILHSVVKQLLAVTGVLISVELISRVTEEKREILKRLLSIFFDRWVPSERTAVAGKMPRAA